MKRTFKKSCFIICFGMFIFFLLSSCKEEGYAIINIQGTLKDSENNEIDNLLITIHNTKMNTSDIFRSSINNNGFDRTYILEKAEACNYVIEVEDGDGEKNGGFFETQTKTIDVLMSDYENRNDLLVVHPYAKKKINFIMIKK